MMEAFAKCIFCRSVFSSQSPPKLMGEVGYSCCESCCRSDFELGSTPPSYKRTEEDFKYTSNFHLLSLISNEAANGDSSCSSHSCGACCKPFGLTRYPMVHKCGHTFYCEDCSEKAAEQNGNKCPICNSRFHCKVIKNHSYLQALISQQYQAAAFVSNGKKEDSLSIDNDDDELVAQFYQSKLQEIALYSNAIHHLDEVLPLLTKNYKEKKRILKQYTKITTKLQGRINQHKRDLAFNYDRDSFLFHTSYSVKECKGNGSNGSNGNGHGSGYGGVYWPLQEAITRITTTTTNVTEVEEDDSNNAEEAEEARATAAVTSLQPPQPQDQPTTTTNTTFSLTERIKQARYAQNNNNNNENSKAIIINTQIDKHFDFHPSIQALFDELPDMKETEIKLYKRLQAQLKARLHGIEDETQLRQLQGTIRIVAKRLIMLQEHCIVACNDLLVLFAANRAATNCDAVSKKKRKNTIERMLLGGSSSKLLHLFLVADDDDEEDDDEDEEQEEEDSLVQRLVQSSFIRGNDNDEDDLMIM